METITDIREYAHTGKHQWDTEEGFQIVTSEQVITLAIDSDQQCCESWGYFLTEDDTEKFIGAELRGVRLTDTNRSSRQFFKGWEDTPVGGGDGKYDCFASEEEQVNVYEGDVMFVDIETDQGVLQFVAYNAHNGYYGHEARVSSTQLTEKRYL